MKAKTLVVDFFSYVQAMVKPQFSLKGLKYKEVKHELVEGV